MNTTRSTIADYYFKKNISFHYYGHSLQFHVSDALFSSKEVDVGTQLLLRSLHDPKYADAIKLLDLGCGYGPIGTALKALNSKRIIHMTDRDALAVAYAEQNARLNGFNDTVTYGSLGFDSVIDKDFDLIVSNIPAKVGEKAITAFLYEAKHYLQLQGTVAIVVVRALVPLVKQLLESNAGITITLEKVTPSYAAYHYTFTEENKNNAPVKTSFEQGVYESGLARLNYRGLPYQLHLAQNLAEIDSPSPETEIVLNYLTRLKGFQPNSALIFNPGQGHIPAVLAKLHKLKTLTLADRDLLSLHYSQMNAQLNGQADGTTNLVHTTGAAFTTTQTYDLAIVKLREDEGTAASLALVQNVGAQLSSKGIMLVASTSTQITRLTEKIRGTKIVTIKDRKKTKARSLLILRRAA